MSKQPKRRIDKTLRGIMKSIVTLVEKDCRRWSADVALAPTFDPAMDLDLDTHFSEIVVRPPQAATIDISIRIYAPHSAGPPIAAVPPSKSRDVARRAARRATRRRK